MLLKAYVFIPVCQPFCSQGGVYLSACWDTHPQADTPQEQTPPWADTPSWAHPPTGQTPPPGQTSPLGRHPPPSAYWDTPPCPVHAGIDMATAAVGTHPTGMHSCLLSMNYCVKYSPNNGLYFTKWTHSHLQFGQLLHGLKSSIIGCVPFFAIVWTGKFTQ